jgi:hypothetical protein
MEIPAIQNYEHSGQNCKGEGFACPFYSHYNRGWNDYLDNFDEHDRCSNPNLKSDDGIPDGELCNCLDPLRSVACLSAYPNGAVITITAKPQDFPVVLLPSDETADIMSQLAHETAEKEAK